MLTINVFVTYIKDTHINLALKRYLYGNIIMKIKYVKSYNLKVSIWLQKRCVDYLSRPKIQGKMGTTGWDKEAILYIGI